MNSLITFAERSVEGQMCDGPMISWVAHTLRYCSGRIREPGFIFFSTLVYGSGEPGQVLKHSELITYDLINTKV